MIDFFLKKISGRLIKKKVAHVNAWACVLCLYVCLRMNEILVGYPGQGNEMRVRQEGNVSVQTRIRRYVKGFV